MNCLQKGPDFILGGAMKAGTSTIRRLIEHSDEVFIPEGELFFFDVDDVHQHPDFLLRKDDRLSFPDFEDAPDKYIDWYASFFQQANEGQVTGDYSSTYFASRIAPQRIASLCPSVKLIFSLRDPVERAYSHYWHQVRTGREIHTFEDVLRYYPERILQRSYYKRHLSRYRSLFSDEKIKIVIFEQLIDHMQQVTNEVYEFLGLTDMPDIEQLNTHQNPSRIPLLPSFNRWMNMMLKPLIKRKYAKHLPGVTSSFIGENVRYMYKFIRYLTSLRREKPEMKEGTRKLLEGHMRRENRGLSEMIGKDLSMYWRWL